MVACDFYNAGALLPLSNEAIVDLLNKELLPSAVGAFGGAVVDAHALPGRGVVALAGVVPHGRRCRRRCPTVCAGDRVRMGEREHGAKGSAERAYVSGLEAANALARDGRLGPERKAQHPVIPIRDDEPQVVAGRKANAAFQGLFKPLGLDSPWVR